MDRRIAAPKGSEKLLERLQSPIPGTSGERLFETKQKALMFAAGLGYKRGSRKEGKRDSSSAVRYDIFETAHDDAFVDILGIVESGGDLNVLADERSEEVVNTFEEYARAGLEELERVCFGGTKDPLDALVDLVISSRHAGNGISSFPGVDAGLLEDILNG